MVRRHLLLLDKFIMRHKRIDLRTVDCSAEELEAAQAAAKEDSSLRSQAAEAFFRV